MFAMNRLPQFNHAVFNHSTFNTASSHGFFISVQSTEPGFDEKKVSAFFETLGGKNIEVVEEDA